MKKTIIEPARAIPVEFDVDVVVCGGGTAGLAAAVCAAREGLSVLMVERAAAPGGMVTHVTSWLNDFDNKGGFPREFINHLRAEGIAGKSYYNPWRVVPYFDALLAASGVQILYLANAVAPLLDHGRLTGVVVESKSGRAAALAKIVIDATGDGDIAARAGAAFEQGRPGDGAVQAVSTTQAFMNYTAGTLDTGAMNAVLANAVTASGKPWWQPYDRWHPAPATGTVNTLLQSVPHATGFNPVDAVELTGALVETRRQSNELFALLAAHGDGFGGIEYGPFAAIPGVRESRRIVCDKRVTRAHVLAGARFDDGLFTVGQNIDIHRRDRVEPAIQCEKVRPYHIPYGALLPRGLDNILVAGRCIDGEHEALASYRIIADCMAMGEAAALAAHAAIRAARPLRETPAAEIASRMAARGYEI